VPAPRCGGLVLRGHSVEHFHCRTVVSHVAILLKSAAGVTEVAVSVPACASPCCGLVSVALVLGSSGVMPHLPDGC
jgi:hypothetical protein